MPLFLENARGTCKVAKVGSFPPGSYENEKILKMTKKAGSFVGEIAGGGGELQRKNELRHVWFGQKFFTKQSLQEISVGKL